MRSAFSLASPSGQNGRLSIFIFHRVLPKPGLFPDEPDAKRFDELMGWIKSWFNVLPLDDAIVQLREQSLPARAAAIAFDDGYADNFTLALPILLKHKMSATLFIATGLLDGGRMWNDTINVDAVPGRVRLKCRSLRRSGYVAHHRTPFG
jgi:peptidoglycan/xylan/chitin deacetylase (PgdA/CDA1 family)